MLDHGEPVLCIRVLIFQLVPRRKRWFFAGCYIPPGSVVETEYITKALYHCTDGLELILVGDLNFNLSQPEGIDIDKYFMVILVVEEIK